ncbi:hypothetical protein VUR80DRAFT_5933 [Thermomyces stellatus]
MSAVLPRITLVLRRRTNAMRRPSERWRRRGSGWGSAVSRHGGQIHGSRRWAGLREMLPWDSRQLEPTDDREKRRRTIGGCLLPPPAPQRRPGRRLGGAPRGFTPQQPRWCQTMRARYLMGWAPCGGRCAQNSPGTRLQSSFPRGLLSRGPSPKRIPHLTSI